MSWRRRTPGSSSSTSPSSSSSFDWSGTGKSYGFVEPMGRGTGGVYFLIGRGVSYSKEAGRSLRLLQSGRHVAAHLRAWLDPGARGLEARQRRRPSRPRAVWLLREPSDIRQRPGGDDHRLGRYRHAFLFRRTRRSRARPARRLTPGASKVFDRTAKDWIKRGRRLQPCALSWRHGLAVLRPDDGGEQGGGLGSRGLPLQPGSLDQAGRLSRTSGIQPSRDARRSRIRSRSSMPAWIRPTPSNISRRSARRLAIPMRCSICRSPAAASITMRSTSRRRASWLARSAPSRR